MRAEHHRWTMAKPASAIADTTTTEASTAINFLSLFGIALSRIDRKANGGTSSSNAVTKMVARQRTVIKRYGLANRHARFTAPSWMCDPLIASASPGNNQ